MRTRPRRLELQRPGERLRRALQISRVEQVIAKAVPGLRIVRLGVTQQAVDPCGLHVIAFRAEARGREGADVGIDVPFSLQQRTEEREGFLRPALLEELVGPLYARRGGWTGCGSGRPFPRHSTTSEGAPGRRPSLPGGGAASPRTRPRRSSRSRVAGSVRPP